MSTADENPEDHLAATPLDQDELQELIAETQIDASPEQMQAILAFIEEAGGLEEAQQLIEMLRKAA
jgi:hypothetical protein